MDPLKLALTDLTQLLSESDISYAVIGGLAVSARGRVRVTEDVDVVVACDWDDATALLERVRTQDRTASAFQEASNESETILAQGLLLPLVHRRSKVPVDIAIGLSEFERSVVARGEVADVAGLSLPVVSLGDLLIMKVVAGRARDVEDAESLVSAAATVIDWEYCLSIAEQIDAEVGLGVAQRIEQLRDSSS